MTNKQFGGNYFKNRTPSPMEFRNWTALFKLCPITDRYIDFAILLSMPVDLFIYIVHEMTRRYTSDNTLALANSFSIDLRMFYSLWFRNVNISPVCKGENEFNRREIIFGIVVVRCIYHWSSFNQDFQE